MTQNQLYPADPAARGTGALHTARLAPAKWCERFDDVAVPSDDDPTEPGPVLHMVMQRSSSVARPPRLSADRFDCSKDVKMKYSKSQGAMAESARAGSDALVNASHVSRLSAERNALGDIVGQTPAIRRLRASVERIARVPVDVLLIGETGTGKDLVLQTLHALSERPGPLVAVNCGAIPDTLFESELFGHEAGAFTGAIKGRPGKFEQAHRGTLFLDEIDSMPMHQQVKLLRVLESRRVDRIGGRGESPLDLRVVAASQGRLEERCKLGQFRLDLWHRLNVVTLQIPALRERREDVAPLFWVHVDEACMRYGVAPASLPAIDTARLSAYDWPGNVRELKHAAERFVLGLKVLPDEAGAPHQDHEVNAKGLFSHLAVCERELINAALARHGRRLAEVAAELAISEKTLLRRIAAYRLDGAVDGAA